MIGQGNYGSVIGSVMGNEYNKTRKSSVPVQPPVLSDDLPRGINYYADLAGCGHWRMIWPENLLNGYTQGVIHGTTRMMTEPRVYDDIDTVRIQRQAGESQLQFVKLLKNIQKHAGFKLIYELDDVHLYEDIPMYNKFRSAFANDVTRQCIIDIMNMCDEITVTCNYMKQYFIDKLSKKEVTVIPNYVPRFWMDSFYDEKKISLKYDKHVKKKKKPRVLWSGSGAHLDVSNTGAADDFNHVVEIVKKTIDKYQWVFVGAYPMELKPLINNKIEFHRWNPIYEYPRMLDALDINVSIAPLQDNVFNRCKSDLKHLEGSAMGFPVICQDMITYKHAQHKFTTGDEMVDQIDAVLRDKNTLMRSCRAHHKVIETRWLENNIVKYRELYKYGYCDPARVHLNAINSCSI